MSKPPAARGAVSTKKRDASKKAGNQPSANEKQLQQKIDQLKNEVIILRNNLDPDKIEEELKKVHKVSGYDMAAMLEVQNRHLEYTLKEYEDKTNITRDQIKTLSQNEKDVTDLKREIGVLKAENKTLTSQITGKEKEIQGLQTKLQAAENLNDARGKDLQELRQSEGSLNILIREMEKQCSETKFHLDKYEKGISKIFEKRPSKEQDDKLKRENKELLKKLDAKDDQLEQIVKLNKKIDDLTKEVTTKEDEAIKLQNEITTLRGSNGDDSKANEAYVSKIEELKSALKGREEELNQQKDYAENERINLNRELGEWNDKFTKLKKNFDENEEKLHKTTNDKVLKERDERINSLEDKLKDRESDIEKLKGEKGTLDRDIERLKKETENSNRDNTRLVNDKENEIKQMVERHKKEIEQKESTIAQLKKDESEKTRVKSGNKGSKELNEKYENTSRELHDAKEEIGELKQRLSQVVGAKLMDDNPNITDLSDQNRPTKLSEKYSELYDNEWTDAYEEMENEFKTEQETIKHLYHKVLDIFAFCQKSSEEYARTLKTSALSFHADGGRPKSAKIGVTSMRQLKELRKSFSPLLADNVFQHYAKTKGLDFKKKVKLEKFVKQCLSICWLMSNQDPPVILDTGNTSGAFDGDRFRTYTKTGKTVDFVVWPPMLLHENGPLLCKGVAQGK